MKKIRRKNHNYFIIIAVSILFILCIAGSMQNNDIGKISDIREESESIEETGEITKEKEQENPEKTEELKKPEIPYEAESFGKYLEILCKEGRKTELNDRAISEELDREKAAVLAGKSPLLEHLRIYAEEEELFNTAEYHVFTADINRDGVEDVIEYGIYKERTFRDVNMDLLTVYLGIEEGGFICSCSKPILPASSGNDTDIVRIVEYRGETYLVIEWKTGFGEEQSRITVYWISDGLPKGKLEFDWECQDIKAVVTERTDGYNADFLERDRMVLYHAIDINEKHCKIDKYTLLQEEDREWQDMCGNGERVTPGMANEEMYNALMEGYSEKYREEQKPYVEKYSEEISGYNITSMTNVYESDLNNDGITEKYVKAVKDLFLREGGFIGTPFITGEYYGFHEGRRGLMYYMESDGEETDFLKMCGLDIWGGDMTPLNFWVEKTEKGNVTYIAYQDGDGHRQFIEGCLIQGNGYDRVVSAWYIPEIECSMEYMAVEEPEGTGYIVHNSEDRKSFEMKWGEKNDKEEMINRNIRELLEEAMGTIDLKGGEMGKVYYKPVEAGKEKFIADCTIYYEIPWQENRNEDRYMKDFRICIDIPTGKCEGIYDNVIYGSLKNAYYGPQCD